MDLSPLASRDFRVLFGSGTVTLLGTEATDVALVVQVKQLTGSALAVGLLGAAEPVPPGGVRPVRRGAGRPAGPAPGGPPVRGGLVSLALPAFTATWPRPFPGKLLRVIVKPNLSHSEY